MYGWFLYSFTAQVLARQHLVDGDSIESVKTMVAFCLKVCVFIGSA